MADKLYDIEKVRRDGLSAAANGAFDPVLGTAERTLCVDDPILLAQGAFMVDAGRLPVPASPSATRRSNRSRRLAGSRPASAVS